MVDLLRLATAGNVDDGKSTLIGRLLFDSQVIHEDQLASVREASARGGEEGTNLALLLDGLRAEREQGITIDVAYRYFSTPERTFILADCPGHLEYTRNMVTGASTADVALILVDARKGLMEQTKRHGYIAAILGIPRVLVCVNKMDLEQFRESAFQAVRQAFLQFAGNLAFSEITFVPVCAKDGDNVVTPSARLHWYSGPTVLDYLSKVPVSSNGAQGAFRLPIQLALRNTGGSVGYARAYAGRISGGTVRTGDRLVALPSGRVTEVRAIEVAGHSVLEAGEGLSVALSLSDELDLCRGDCLASSDHPPTVSTEIEATLCWLSDVPLDPRRRYLVRHTTAETQAKITAILHHVDITTLEHREGGAHLGQNEFARVRLTTAQPLIQDPYERNRTTGSFILVDEASHATVAAGMIQRTPDASSPPTHSTLFKLEASR